MTSDFLQFWKALTGGINSDPAHRQRSVVKGVTVHTVTSPSNVIRHDVKHVRPDTTPLIEQRGWRRRGNTWAGSYATRYGTWPGRIERRGDIFHVFINYRRWSSAATGTSVSRNRAVDGGRSTSTTSPSMAIPAPS